MTVPFRTHLDRVKRACSATGLPALAAAGLLLASSCQTARPTASNGPAPPAPRVTSRATESQPAQPADDPNIYHAVVSEPGPASVIERLGYEAVVETADADLVRAGADFEAAMDLARAEADADGPSEPDLDVVRTPADADAVQTADVAPPRVPDVVQAGVDVLVAESQAAAEVVRAEDSDIVQVGHEVSAEPATLTSVTPIVHAVEERVALDETHGAVDSQQARCFPDEYICDGGDRGYPVHFNGPVRQGLETEDTVGEFVDENGERQIRPSSQACVYAPRFAAVRSISQPVLDYSVDKPAGAHDGVSLAALDRELGPETQAQFDQPGGFDTRSRASGLGADAGDSSVEQVERTEQHLKIQNVYEDRNFFSEGQFDQGTEAVLAYGIQMAGMWTRDLNPMIVAADESGQQVSGQFKAEEYSVAEDQRTPGELLIIKTADKAFAHSGDEITFTIRFTNGGGRPLYQVRIMDHLTPRIEYVPGSAVSELDGRLDLVDEDDGTQMLTFELAEPLEGAQTGEITFRVKVR